MEYTEAIDFLYSQLPMYQRVGASAFKKDLSNTLALCSYLGTPQNDFKTVHIAGTNGKGTSAHMLASVLQEAGYKTGLYTSPHLKSFTERIRINGEEIGTGDVVSFVEKIQPIISTIKPSFFEITVAMAFYYFSQMKVDIAVIEVGLGGRLDSTNVISPLVSLITNIGMDHQQMLGNTLDKIAYEKAGIIKNNAHVVIGTTQPETKPVFEIKANQMKTEISFADQEFPLGDLVSGYHVCGSSFILSHEVLKTLPEYQIRNIPGVIGTINQLCRQGFTIKKEDIIQGISDFKTNTGLKGRWQTLNDVPLTITDVGHNEDGIRYIEKELSKIDYENLIIVWGMVSDKDPYSLIKLLPKDAFFIFCKPDIPRAMDPNMLIESIQSLSLDFEIIPDVNKAISRAKKIAEPDDMIFIGGSTFVVAEINNL